MPFYRIAFHLNWMVILGVAAAPTYAEKKFKSAGSMPPLMIDNSKNVRHYSNLRISNRFGPCIVIKNSSNVEIINSNIGPCNGPGVVIMSSSFLTLRRNFVHDTASNGIQIYNSSKVDILYNKFSRNSSSVYALFSSSIKINRNSFFNVLGPKPRGQFIQFNDVSGPYNEIICNIAISQMGKGSPEDGISIYRSRGMPNSHILISGNIINGGGPSASGGGIMIGDGGSTQYVSASGNILINPGQYGIAVAGGSHIQVSGNFIYGRSQRFTNVGLYAWNQNPTQCSDVRMNRNHIYWLNAKNKPNPYWNAKNCGVIAKDSQVFKWSPSLAKNIYFIRPKECLTASGLSG